MVEDDIVDRLNAACVGHPHAKIEWPHRLLHDAVDTILALRAAQVVLVHHCNICGGTVDLSNASAPTIGYTQAGRMKSK